MHSAGSQAEFWIHGVRCAFGPRETAHASLKVSGRDISTIRFASQSQPAERPGDGTIDLSGLLVLPGLVNAHDHLHFSLFPPLGEGPYENYIEWGEDIHRRFRREINLQKAVPKSTRLWWGGIRNLLCGVTTVCHHDFLWPELQKPDFPVKIVQRYGWAHSPALGGDLRAARNATPPGGPFIIHACEGTDELARNEFAELQRLELLDEALVLVHALALNSASAAAMQRHRCALILCPSSNVFLFGKLPDLDLVGSIHRTALGNDSPLTAIGDLLDEIRFAARTCKFPAAALYHMVTQAAAEVLRLDGGEGTIEVSGPADLIAVRDDGLDPADKLASISSRDIEFVMVNGQIKVASERVWKRLPDSAKHGMEPLQIDGLFRWVRAPIHSLLREAESALGAGEVKLGGRTVHVACPHSLTAPSAAAAII